MAEFLGQKQDLMEDFDSESGMEAMGKPVPFYRREAGYQHCNKMGLDSDQSFAAVGGMCEGLERDEPYNAMQAGMKYLDLTGTYRLMAVLCCAPSPVVRAIPPLEDVR